ncbi:SusC/RagA family TonB-linked outer membrane protein [Arenibacter lacus]|uniref:SusC/RagA family TonB-linked outer membrane protein n=1 Tax=Arenibacter lacus TaxID=2608629 RepID=UPI001CC60B41|nr:TonB-dependent receptor [Arenibacter lacus]
MKKKYYGLINWSCPQLKFNFKKRLSLLFMLWAFFAMQANPSYSQQTEITLNLTNVSVERIIDEIESKTDFHFVYQIKEVDLNRVVSINVQKEKVTNILQSIFSNTRTTHEVLDKQIFLKERISSPTALTHQAYAEVQTKISGQVTDETGTPLSGANILEKGTTNGVIADFDGNFSLEVSSENAVLVISYLGFLTKEQPIAGLQQLNVVLQEDSAKLDEVIVTGYTSQRKSDLTGAVSIVNIDEMTDQPLASVNEIVQGRSAGVEVLSSNSPGGNAAIRIRGFSTIRNNDPLYVIDGVPTTSGINLINPNDIESLQVLKDASSASIYGSRAANGVVVITTKKGREGKVKIAYDGYAGAMTVMQLPKLASASQYGEGLWQAFANDGITPSNDIYGSGSTPVIPAFLDAENTIPSANTDWLGALFNTALVTSHNISFSSGTDTSNSFFSLGYYKQDGILKHTGFDRYTFRANTNYKLGSKVTVGENFSFSLSKNTDINTNALLGSPIYSAFLMPSIAPVYNTNGEFTGYPLDDIENPLGRLYRNRNNEDQTLRLFGNVFAEIELAKGLTFKTNYGLTASNFSATNFSPTYKEPNTQRVAASLSKSEQKLMEWTFTNTLNYDASYNDLHNINLLAGYESIESKLETLSAFRQGFPGNDPNFQVLNAGDAGTQQNSNAKIESSLVSYFGKANYSYDDRYLASYTLRRDGTSKLANNKWGTFSAASLGWKISNEAFFQSENINDLKLRLGWGQNGNQDIPPYVTSSGYFSNPFNSNYSMDGTQNSVYNGYIMSRNSNPDLKWETTEQYNIGLDLGLLSNRLTFTLDYFDKTTEDLLLERQLAPVAGGTNSSVWDNVGTMNNKGFELGANYRNDYDRELQVSAGLNLSIIRNELTSLKEGVDFVGIDPVTLHTNNFDQEVSRTAVGQPIASFYGWVADGIFQDQAEIDAHPFQNAATAPGDIRFRDINNDNVIDDKDRQFIGNPHPDFSLNLNLNFEYKNFDLTTFFRSSFGNDVYDLTRYYSDFYNLSSYNKHSRIADAWTPTNTGSSIPRLSLNDPNNNIRPSSYYVKDGTFVKLQTLQMGYNFTSSTLESLSLSRLRLYLNLQNVFTITGYDGIDPEIGLQNYRSDDRNLDIGVDRAIYPPSRTYTLGLNIAF